MEKLTTFILDNYYILLGIVIFLIIALIGYFVDSKRKKEIPYLVSKEDIDLSKLNGNENVSLQEMVNKSAGVVNMNTNENDKLKINQ